MRLLWDQMSERTSTNVVIVRCLDLRMLITPSSIEPKLRKFVALCPNLETFIDSWNTVHVFPKSTTWITTTLREGKGVPAAFEAPGLQTLILSASHSGTKEVDSFPLKVQAICQHINRLEKLVFESPNTSDWRQGIVRDPLPPGLEYVHHMSVHATNSVDPFDMLGQALLVSAPKFMGYVSEFGLIPASSVGLLVMASAHSNQVPEPRPRHDF